jgi:hypothetical protein
MLLAVPCFQGSAAALALTDCSGKSYDYVVDTYANTGFPAIPLRCGTQTFGLTHIAQRGHLDATTNGNITATLKYGVPKLNDKGAKVLYDSSCNLRYTVAFGYNAWRGSDPLANPVGIITAYPPNTALSTSLRPDAAGYRSDCVQWSRI